MIDRAQAFDLLRAMVRIPSFSGNELKLAQYLCEQLRAWGFHTSIDEAGNLVAETGAPTGPLVMLLGHLDTVCSFLPVREQEGVLFGRGAVDAKGPLATFICAAALSRNLPLRLIVAGATGEESDSAGAIALRSRYRPEAVFIGEPSGADGVAIGYKGQVKGRFAATQATRHPATPSRNAIETAVDFWRALCGLCNEWSGDKSVFDAATPVLTEIRGTADHAQLDFDIRLPNGFDIDVILSGTLGWQDHGSLHFRDYVAAALHDKNSSPAVALRSAIRAAGFVPKIKVKSGTSDMNTVAGYWTAPCVAYGPGDSQLDHTADEHIALDEYWSAISVLTTALDNLCHRMIPKPDAVSAGNIAQ